MIMILIEKKHLNILLKTTKIQNLLMRDRLIHSFYKFKSNYLFEFNYNIIIKLFEVLNIKLKISYSVS